MDDSGRGRARCRSEEAVARTNVKIFRDREDVFHLIAMLLALTIFLTMVGMQAASTEIQATAIIRQIKILTIILAVDLGVAGWRIVKRRSKK